GADANGRCHSIVTSYLWRMILSENRVPLFRIMRAQPPQPPTVTLTSLSERNSLPPASTRTMTLLVFAILMRFATLGTVPAGILYDATSTTGFSATRNAIELTSASVVVTDTGTTAPFSAISGASSLILSEASAVLP